MRHLSLSPFVRQTGGTLLGLIIGLIIGLGIAVVVALTINRTSLPFLNKQARPDRVEVAPGQAIDPNKPLYGNKAPAREAAKDFANAEPLPPPPPNAADPQAAKNAAAKEVTPTPAAEKLKKQDAAKEALAKAGAAKSDADEKWTYYLQAGAFRDQSDADGARAKLALLGFEARVTDRPGENGTLYRVRIGPFGQLDTMNRMRGKLSDNGVDVAVVRIPKNP
jgi:cell division protein FtsN